jgi:hypothetical protein
LVLSAGPLAIAATSFDSGTNGALHDWPELSLGHPPL